MQPMPPTAPMPQPAAAFDAPRAPRRHAPLSPMPVATIEEIAAQSAAGGRCRPPRLRDRHRAQCRHHLCRHHAGARAGRATPTWCCVDLAFGAPNVSVISTDPNAPGIAELVRGEASFGDIITRDQYSRVHLVATGNVGADGPALAASPMLATVVEALVRSYDHVVIDAGAAADVAVERLAPLAQQRGAGERRSGRPATRAARERLMMAGFADVTRAGGRQRRWPPPKSGLAEKRARSRRASRTSAHSERRCLIGALGGGAQAEPTASRRPAGSAAGSCRTAARRRRRTGSCNGHRRCRGRRCAGRARSSAAPDAASNCSPGLSDARSGP